MTILRMKAMKVVKAVKKLPNKHITEKEKNL